MKLVTVTLLVLGAAPAWAQVPAGGPFRVSTSNSGRVRLQAAASPQGEMAVVWSSEFLDIPALPWEQPAVASFGIVGRRYDAAGVPRGPEFIVSGEFNYFEVGTAFAGRDLAVVWERLENGDHDVFLQRLDASGAGRGPAQRVNTFTTGRQSAPAVASDPSGRMVVAWSSDGQDGSGTGVYARRYDAAGAPAGAEFLVNTLTLGSQGQPAVARDAAGNFVVLWTDAGPSVRGQRFNAAGARVGAEFRAASGPVLGETQPAVSYEPGGGFVAAWNTIAAPPGPGIYARRFDASGAAVGADFRVNTTGGSVALPSVAVDGLGAFTLAWTDLGPRAVRLQRFTASGQPRGAEFTVVSSINVDVGRMAGDGAGNLLPAWAQAFGIAASEPFAQRIGGIVPAALAADTAASATSNGNFVLEPGEGVDLRPSWLNANGAAQTLSGTALAFSGPAAPGVTYELTDGSGSYGSVPSGATGACSDCYQAGVGIGAARPALHWDAVLAERLAPDVLGQHQAWAVHVGRSFPDVPSTSFYYRDVETVLHRGVTAGCAGGLFCPGDGTTREQMAAFLIAAREGPAFVPRACTLPSMFADVPPASPFRNVIEELARRGVTGGCGGGNYCPHSGVSRDQMAVFLLRTLDPSAAPPACGTPRFGDVPANNPFCPYIEELARRGITAGCGGGNYCPTAVVIREQMATFLTGTFGLTLYGP